MCTAGQRSHFTRICLAALFAIINCGSLGAQTYREADGSTLEPWQCWGPESFYSNKNPLYFEFRNTGYFFDPNPFQLRTYLGGRMDWAEMWPASGNKTLKSVNAPKAWKNPSITVQCFLRRYWTGRNVPYMVIKSENGSIEDLSVACADGPIDPFLTAPYADSYDPGDPYSLPSGSSSDPDGLAVASDDCTGGAEGDGGCQSVYLRIEVSYDGGVTWQPYWEGWGTVCE